MTKRCLAEKIRYWQISPSKSFCPFVIAFHLLLFNCPQLAHSLQIGNLKLTPEVALRSEYNDNVNLSSGIKDEEVKEDFTFYIAPLINLLLPFKDHLFSLIFEADYRQGVKTALKDVNLNIISDVGMNFTGGLQLKLTDTYNKSSFDQGLYDEPGITDSTSNNYGIAASYTFVERLKLDGGYDHKWEEFIENTQPVKREIDIFRGKLSIPVAWSTLAYTSYYFQTQDSPQRDYRNYDKNRYLFGALWKGAYRFSMWLEGGYEEIVYQHPTDQNFSNVIGNMGVSVKWTEFTRAEISIGKDGYGNLVYNGEIFHQHPKHVWVNLSGSRQTQSSFSSTFRSSTYESTKVNLEFIKEILNRVTVRLEGSYQLQEAFSLTEDQQEEIWIAKISLAYPIHDWIRAGTHYQYATRNSHRKEDEYKNNRIGLFIRFIF